MKLSFVSHSLLLIKSLLVFQVMKENVSTTANDTKTALNKLPSNTTATKLVPSQPPPVIKQNLSAKVQLLLLSPPLFSLSPA